MKILNIYIFDFSLLNAYMKQKLSIMIARFIRQWYYQFQNWTIMDLHLNYKENLRLNAKTTLLFRMLTKKEIPKWKTKQPNTFTFAERKFIAAASLDDLCSALFRCLIRNTCTSSVYGPICFKSVLVSTKFSIETPELALLIELYLQIFHGRHDFSV